MDLYRASCRRRSDGPGKGEKQNLLDRVVGICDSTNSLRFVHNPISLLHLDTRGIVGFLRLAAAEIEEVHAGGIDGRTDRACVGASTNPLSHSRGGRIDTSSDLANP